MQLRPAARVYPPLCATIFLPLLEKMQLQYLHTNLTALCGVGSAIDPTRPLFRILTHLELWGKCDDGLHIANLPALTHLCLMAPGVPSVLLSILCNC
ncbi:hypothetical protein C8J57DRAFT_1318775, partial [Mycena rebaudengoi]